MDEEGLNLNLHILDSSLLEITESCKYLGMWLQPNVSFHKHSVTNKLTNHLKTLDQPVNWFNFHVTKRLISQLLLLILDYSDLINHILM